MDEETEDMLTEEERRRKHELEELVIRYIDMRCSGAIVATFVAGVADGSSLLTLLLDDGCLRHHGRCPRTRRTRKG